MTTQTTTRTLTVDGIGACAVTVTDTGAGHPFLLLHGGGGPQTVAGFAETLAGVHHARVVAPIHPGFAGTPRPESLSDIAGLARLYVTLLEDLDLRDVTVVGNSIGGWIAAEMALLTAAGESRVSSYVLANAVGILVPEAPGADFFSLTLEQVVDLAYYEPDRFRIDPATLPPTMAAALPGNRASLETYAGTAMADPTLRSRLGAVRAPVLVVWGEADRIATAEFGRALAAAIPGARFTLMERTGHMPQLETPERLADVVWEYAESHAQLRPGSAR